MLFLQDYMQGGVFQRSGMRGFERKIKEAIVAVQLEKRYTKREIFTFYANHVTMGHGAYGVEAGARLYFDKPAKDVTLEEAATIAAIVQTPARLSPFVNPEQALARRNNYVLPRMADEGFITDEEAEAGRGTPAGRAGPGDARSVDCALLRRGNPQGPRSRSSRADELYQAGFQVQTTLDAELQEAANRALDQGLRRIDKRRSGYRKPARNVVAEGHALDRFTTPRWTQPMLQGDIVPAVVTAVAARGAAAASASAARARPARLGIRLDQAHVGGRSVHGRRPDRGGSPLGEAAACPRRSRSNRRRSSKARCVAIDNRSGEIRAMVGGFSFDRSKFNRATQARRQLGSIFKPIVYTTAIDRGFTPVSVFIDEPVVARAGSESAALFEPMNYDRKFEGPVTLRRALEQSRNIPAVKAMLEVGPPQVVDYAGRFGLPGNFQPFLSLALGSAEATLRRRHRGLLGVSEPGRAHDAVSASRRSPTARATSSSRTGRRPTRRSAPTPRSS